MRKSLITVVTLVGRTIKEQSKPAREQILDHWNMCGLWDRRSYCFWPEVPHGCWPDEEEQSKLSNFWRTHWHQQRGSS